MAFVLKDRVKETTTTTGTGAVVLSGAENGFDSFSSVGDGNNCYYTIARALAPGDEWETGIGTYTAAGPTLSRDTVLASSNAGSLVNFGTGSKEVFVSLPAVRSGYVPATTTAGSIPFADGSGGFSESNAQLFHDSTNNTTGFGTTRTGAISGTNPTVRIKGSGATSATSGFEVQDSAGSSKFLIRDDGKFLSAAFDLTRAAGTGTVVPLVTFTPAADTALTASTESTSINFNLSATRQFATGALTTQRAMRIQAPTYSFVGASTITTASTLEISGPPIAGTNATITNTLALNVASGSTRFSGLVGINEVAPGAQLHVQTNATTTKALLLKATASQSANMVEVQNSAGTNMVMVDSSGKVGIGVAPSELLQIRYGIGGGAVRFDRSSNYQHYLGMSATSELFFSKLDTTSANRIITLNANSNVLIGGTTDNARLSVTRAVATGTVLPLVLFTSAADTALTASTESISFDVNTAATRQFATGAIATQRASVFRAPTYAAVAASTMTSGATLAITGAPVAGTNMTITNSYALWVQAGATKLAGNCGFWGAEPSAQPSGIVNADGSLADITTKFNTLISALETIGILATV